MRRKSSLIALAATSALFVSGAAFAGPITYTVNSVDPGQAEADFLSTLAPGHVTEDFEKLTPGTQQEIFVTKVGEFEQGLSGSGGLCGTKCSDGLVIYDSNTLPKFSGRFNTTTDGKNWLDSFDSQEVFFRPITGVNAIGFYVSDPNDVNGTFGVELNDGSVHFISDIFGGGQSSGALFYVTFTSSSDITGLLMLAKATNDGFGIDDVTVSRVPEPGTLALLGLGLLGVGLMRRRG